MANWFTYDWQEKGETAKYAVDLALGEQGSAEDYPFVFRLYCSAPKEINGRCRRHADAILTKCVKEGFLFAGRVDTATCIQFYFYGKAKVSLASMEYAYAKEKLLSCRADVQEDPSWSFYGEQLCPDAAKYQTEQNREMIARMAKAGDYTPASRRVRLHMFFPSEPLLVMFSEQARHAGFALSDTQFYPDMERAYGIAIIKIATLNKPDVDALTTSAIYLAQNYDGTLLYWDAPVVPKHSPLR
ncbi:MAG: DUF695 domain-containing protein [Clostridia bacterium]|nr:DUF695 domain-containing protein [Clostridia bacterium]